MQGGDKYSPLDFHLASMLSLTGRSFPPDMLDASERRDLFFKPDGEIAALKGSRRLMLP
jgi:hypothetical protein